jgi:hypothetical protein
MAARKHAGVPTARNGPPEPIPTCDWDAGVSEHEKEKNRMFMRGPLAPEAQVLAIVGHVVGIWQRHRREARTRPGQ